VGQRKGEGVEDFFGTVSTYIDADGLKWEYRFRTVAIWKSRIGVYTNQVDMTLTDWIAFGL